MGSTLTVFLDANLMGWSSRILRSEHLDYHQTLSHYFESKKKLFSEFLMKSRKAGRFAVTNHDDPKGEKIVEGIDLPVVRYGLSPSCDISADQVTSNFEGLSCRIKTPRGEFPIHSKLIGEFNVYNILAAVATGIAMDIPLETVKSGVESLEGVSGRFEKIGESERDSCHCGLCSYPRCLGKGSCWA